MDQVLNLLELTTAVGGHTIDLSSKANQTYVDAELAKNADLTYVNTQLSTSSSELDSKVDNFLVTSPLQWQPDPENALATRLEIANGAYATPTYVDTELASKADLTYANT